MTLQEDAVSTSFVSAGRSLAVGTLAERTTFMYLDVLAGKRIEQVAARYGMKTAEAAERIEAARLCYERQVELPGFPLHLL